VLVAIGWLPSCSLFGETEPGEIVRVAAGDSFGECLGYCQRDVEVDRSETKFTASGWNRDGTLPTVDSTRSTDAALFGLLSNAVTWTRFSSLDSVYGCPDCTDGGAEWIELEDASGRVKRVTFEYAFPPEPLTAMADTLRSIRVDYAKQLLPQAILGNQDP
jgi:hypothetical protein